MPIVRVQTRGLLGLLVDLARTTAAGADAGATGGVLLSTGRGHHGAEPGRVELLGGVSTTGRAMGYAHVHCVGQLATPQLWSHRDAHAVVQVFGAAAGKDKDGEHAVEVEQVGAEVLVREDPTLFGDGVSLSFQPLDRADFPARTAYRVLSGASWPEVPKRGRVTVKRDGHDVPDGPRLDVDGAVLAPFVAVGRRRGRPLQLYTRHPLVPVLVQVGDSYRGALAPWAADDDTATDLPDVEMYAEPDLTEWPAPAAAQPLRLVDPVIDPLFDHPEGAP